MVNQEIEAIKNQYQFDEYIKKDYLNQLKAHFEEHDTHSWDAEEFEDFHDRVSHAEGDGWVYEYSIYYAVLLDALKYIHEEAIDYTVEYEEFNIIKNTLHINEPISTRAYNIICDSEKYNNEVWNG